MRHGTANVERCEPHWQLRPTLNVQFTESGRLLFRLRFVLERAFRLIDNRLERGLVADCEIGQDFAVESDAGGFQSFGEAAVSHSVGASGGVEPLDPQITESAFTGFAIAIGPGFAFHRCVFGVTEKLRSATAITFGGFDDAFASRTAGRRVSGSWHLLFCPEL